MAWVQDSFLDATINLVGEGFGTIFNLEFRKPVTGESIIAAEEGEEILVTADIRNDGTFTDMLRIELQDPATGVLLATNSFRDYNLAPGGTIRLNFSMIMPASDLTVRAVGFHSV